MVKPMLRSRSKKKVMKRTPKGKTVLRFKEKKPSKKQCARCKANLAGTPSNIASEIRKLSKTEKAPTRPYRGVLCPACVEALIGYATRFEVKYRNPEFADMELTRDLTLEKFLPKGWYNNLVNKSEVKHSNG